MVDNLKLFFDAVFAGEKQAITLLAAIYFGATGLYGFAYCIWIRSWPTTEGKLLMAGLEKWGASMRASDQDYEAEVRYVYNVDGKDYESTRLSPTLILVSANFRFVLNWQMRGIKKLGADMAEVLYNPSKPEKSYLIRPGAATYFLPTVCILVSILLALYWYNVR